MASEGKRHPAMVRVGDVDQVEGIVGLPGSGKTSLILADQMAQRQEQPTVCLAVDPNGNMPRKLWDGRWTDVERHTQGIARVARDGNGYFRLVQPDPFPQLRERLYQHSRGIYAVRAASATGTLLLATEIADKGKTPEDAEGERYGVPSEILVDEISIWQEASEGKLGDVLEWYLTQRRHLHTKMRFGTQQPQRVHYLVFDLSTRLKLFRVDSEEATTRLRKGGVPRAICEQLPGLKPRQYIDWKRGETTHQLVQL